MQIAVLSSAILAYVFVLLLFRRRVLQAEHMERRIGRVARLGTPSPADASELNRPFSDRFLKPAAKGFVRWLSNLMPMHLNPRLVGNLKMAGLKMNPVDYNALRLVVGVLTGSVGLILMRYWLTSRIRTRKQAIQKQLPEVLDLLSVSVEAGLGFDAALQRISDRAQGPLIDELTATYREITLGRSRSEALRNFEARCGLEDVKSFVGAIIQAEQLGISLKNVLKSQAQQMRLIKRQKVEEKAMKAPVKIILPLVAFVFPVLFIILLGPAVVSILGMKGLFG